MSLSHHDRVSSDHPRVLGSKSRLQALAAQRPEAYRRTIDYALGPEQNEVYGRYAKLIGWGLLHAIEGAPQYARKAIDMVMACHINQPLEIGHIPFGHSVAECALVYDWCHDQWTANERRKFFDYFNATFDANLNEEVSVLHNAWYGYKTWGLGLAAYATLHENPRAGKILDHFLDEYVTRAVPALEAAGDGGGWAEGYYIHFWLYEWLFFHEVAKACEGLDLYALAPRFFKNRALASAFEVYPTLQDDPQGQWLRTVPMGDGAGRLLEHDSDKTLAYRRMLVNHYRDDPLHQAIHSFNELLPRCTRAYNAYKDLFWRDTTVSKRPVDELPLSHHSPGAGFVYARESWKQDATYLFFHCGRRFTSHQHLDNGHFVLWKHTELLGDGGQYDSFDSDHCINYYLRTIAHNAILVYDPNEPWPAHPDRSRLNIRAACPAVNDGGQAYPWPGTPFGHNGGAWDMDAWLANRQLGEIGTILAYRDGGDYVYMAGDYGPSYSATKVKSITREIVYLRPNTLVILDRVESTRPQFTKTFVLQPMAIPEVRGNQLSMIHGQGRLFVQTLLPAQPQPRLYHGDDLYSYHNTPHPAIRCVGKDPQCRVEISPSVPATGDLFLHVLTAADTAVQSVPDATLEQDADHLTLRVGPTVIRFSRTAPGGEIVTGTTSPRPL